MSVVYTYVCMEWQRVALAILIFAFFIVILILIGRFIFLDRETKLFEIDSIGSVFFPIGIDVPVSEDFDQIEELEEKPKTPSQQIEETDTGGAIRNIDTSPTVPTSEASRPFSFRGVLPPIANRVTNNLEPRPVEQTVSNNDVLPQTTVVNNEQNEKLRNELNQIADILLIRSAVENEAISTSLSLYGDPEDFNSLSEISETPEEISALLPSLSSHYLNTAMEFEKIDSPTAFRLANAYRDAGMMYEKFSNAENVSAEEAVEIFNKLFGEITNFYSNVSANSSIFETGDSALRFNGII